MARYYQHFGLQRDPFLDTADPQFYCELPMVRRNAQRVLTGVEDSRGLTVVIGAPGTGKTSLSANLEQTLLADERFVIGKILDPTFASDVEFLLAIGRVFGLALPPRSSAQLKNALKNYFFDTAVLEEKTLVLLIDEAQNLTNDGLETLRLLLNFQVPQRKLLNLVLFGQDELEGKINALENLHDRVDAYVRLEPLDGPSTMALIEHRLVKAGKMPLARLYASDALEMIVLASGGLPRRISSVARTAMVEAADRGSEIVTVDHVTAALRARGLAVPERSPAPAVLSSPTNVIALPSAPAPVTSAARPPSLLARLFARRA
jgi:type II secretory pathway predicted ATPase ExeA